MISQAARLSTVDFFTLLSIFLVAPTAGSAAVFNSASCEVTESESRELLEGQTDVTGSGGWLASPASCEVRYTRMFEGGASSFALAEASADSSTSISAATGFLGLLGIDANAGGGLTMTAAADSQTSIDVNLTTLGLPRPGFLLVNLFSFGGGYDGFSDGEVLVGDLTSTIRAGGFLGGEEGVCRGACTGVFPWTLGAPFRVFSQLETHVAREGGAAPSQSAFLDLRLELRATEPDGSPVPLSAVPEPAVFWSLAVIPPLLALRARRSRPRGRSHPHSRC